MTYEIERDISDFLMAQGFNRIDTPTLEHFEVFSDHVGAPSLSSFSIKRRATGTTARMVTSQIGPGYCFDQGAYADQVFLFRARYFTIKKSCEDLANELSQAGIGSYRLSSSRGGTLEAIKTAKQSLDFSAG